MVAVGAIIVGFNLVRDTTVDLTFNIGLLTAQLMGVIIGCSMVVAGLLLRGLGNLGRDLCESLGKER